MPIVFNLAAVNSPLVDLLKLITVALIVKKIGEVGPEIQIIINNVGRAAPGTPLQVNA